MRDLFTRALYKVSSQDHHVWHLYTRSPARSRHEIPTKDLYEISITGAPYKISSQDLYQARPLWNVSALYKISSQNLYEKSLHKSSLQDLFGLFTGALYKISSQDLYERSLYKSSLQDLFTRPLWESLQDLFARPLWEIQDLFTRPLWLALYKVSSQAPNETSLCKISWYPWTS